MVTTSCAFSNRESQYPRLHLWINRVVHESDQRVDLTRFSLISTNLEIWILYLNHTPRGHTKSLPNGLSTSQWLYLLCFIVHPCPCVCTCGAWSSFFPFSYSCCFLICICFVSVSYSFRLMIQISRLLYWCACGSRASSDRVHFIGPAPSLVIRSPRGDHVFISILLFI